MEQKPRPPREVQPTPHRAWRALGPGASEGLVLAGVGGAAGRTGGGSCVSEDRGPTRVPTAFAFVCIVMIFNKSLCDPPTSLAGTHHRQLGDSEMPSIQRAR